MQSERPDSTSFREALCTFPSGVTIVTTTDDDGRPWGFTASSFSSLSMDPPLVLVCIANTADSHPVFLRARRYAINILSQSQRELAVHFARKNVDKFSGHRFEFRAGHRPAPPHLPESMAVLLCRTHSAHPAGDHTVLIGEVTQALFNQKQIPLVYFNRTFGRFEPETVGAS